MTTAFNSASKDRPPGTASRSYAPGRLAPPRRPSRQRPHQTGAKEFAKSVADACKELLRRDLRAHAADIRQISLREFLARIEEPSCCFGLELRRRMRGRRDTASAWVEISPRLAFVVVNRLLGFREMPEPTPNRPLTALEHRLLERAIEVIAAAVGRAFGHARTLKVGATHDRSHPDAPATADASVTAVTFAVSLDRCEGAVRLCLPSEFLPARNRPNQTLQRATAPLEVSVTAPDTTIAASELADLSAGDILATELPADTEVIVRVAGIPKFAARLGMVNGRRAVTITRRLH